MSIYNSQISHLRDRILNVEKQSKGAQGSWTHQELASICNELLKMIVDLATRK